MTTKTLIPAVLCALAGTCLAGTEQAPLPIETNSGDFNRWLTPTLDLRTRYEFREIDGQDASHALTARARVGLLLGEFAGFSLFGEAEANWAIVNDYRSNPTGNDSTRPYVEGNTPITDPENLELNRTWLRYNNFGVDAKLGRQRIIRNNAAFIGNVGWRQNEQTFDAASLAYGGDNFSLNYAYSNRVLRIFGKEANDAPPGPPLRDFEGDFHFLDGTYKTCFGKVGGYAYLIDVDNNANVGRSNSFGLYTDTGPLHAELAYQDGSTALNNKGDYGSFYGHLIYTYKSNGGCSYLGGLEYLENYFKTPFATVHAFNGFADAFVLQRIGLNDHGGAYDGLSDLYLGFIRPGLPAGITFKGFVHYFMDDGFSDAYGWEADGVLVKKFNDHLNGILKAAYFSADGGGEYKDIQQVTAELNYKF